MLLAAGASRDGNPGKVTPLIAASRSGHLSIARLLLAAGAQVDLSEEEFGHTALTEAADHCHPEVMDLLLESGADPNRKDRDGRTVLHDAAFLNQMSAVSALLSAKADVDAADDEGITPLMEAATKGYLEVVRLLMEAGADTTLRDRTGKTALTRTETFVGGNGHNVEWTVEPSVVALVEELQQARRGQVVSASQRLLPLEVAQIVADYDTMTTERRAVEASQDKL